MSQKSPTTTGKRKSDDNIDSGYRFDAACSACIEVSLQNDFKKITDCADLTSEEIEIKLGKLSDHVMTVVLPKVSDNIVGLHELLTKPSDKISALTGDEKVSDLSRSDLNASQSMAHLIKVRILSDQPAGGQQILTALKQRAEAVYSRVKQLVDGVLCDYRKNYNGVFDDKERLRAEAVAIRQILPRIDMAADLSTGSNSDEREMIKYVKVVGHNAHLLMDLAIVHHLEDNHLEQAVLPSQCRRRETIDIITALAGEASIIMQCLNGLEKWVTMASSRWREVMSSYGIVQTEGIKAGQKFLKITVKLQDKIRLMLKKTRQYIDNRSQLFIKGQYSKIPNKLQIELDKINANATCSWAGYASEIVQDLNVLYGLFTNKHEQLEPMKPMSADAASMYS